MTEELDLTSKDRTSPIEMWSFEVTKSDNCIINIEVMNKAGPTNEYKVKVTGLSVALGNDEGVAHMKNAAKEADQEEHV